jgi:hypothetical protein
VQTDEEVRAWAKLCADITDGRLGEHYIWREIAERGQEFEMARTKAGKPDHGGTLMRQRECFTNSKRTVLGFTHYDPAGCTYAEGFALSSLGMWAHHAWVVTPGGLALDRTWRNGSTCYVGVTLDELGEDITTCELAPYPCGYAWAPNMVKAPEAYDRVFADR